MKEEKLFYLNNMKGMNLIKAKMAFVVLTMFMAIHLDANAYFENGEYYLRTNLGTEEAPNYVYLNAGGDAWGTAAIVDAHGFALEFSKRTDATDGKDYYALKSEVYQEGTSSDRYFNGAYFDQLESNSWIRFDAVTSGGVTVGYRVYAAKNGGTGGGYLYVESGKNTVDPYGKLTQAIVWEVVSEAQRLAEVKEAKFNYPVDATFFLKDPSFSRNNVNKVYWHVNSDSYCMPYENGSNKGNSNNKGVTVDGVKFIVGNTANNNTSKLNNNHDLNMKVQGTTATAVAYDLYQHVSLTNVPNGKYRVAVRGFSNAEGAAVLYASDTNGELGSVELPSNVSVEDAMTAALLFSGNETKFLSAHPEYESLAEDKSKSLAEHLGYSNDGYMSYIDVVVTDGNLTVGVRGNVSNNDIAYFDNFELTYYGTAAEPSLVLYDDRDNSSEVANENGVRCTIKLAGRSINVGGYNTLSLPFSVSAKTLNVTMGKGNWTLKTLADVNVKDSKVVLVFQNANEIEAGKPYLIKVANAVSEPVFHHVLVDAEVENAVEFDNGISFVPVLNYSYVGKVGDEVNSMMFLGGNNVLYFPLEMPTLMKGNRAYFHIADPTILGASRRFALDVDGETTAVLSLEAAEENDNNAAWYTLSGVKLEGAPKSSGMYIKNGKKVVVNY